MQGYYWSNHFVEIPICRVFLPHNASQVFSWGRLFLAFDATYLSPSLAQLKVHEKIGMVGGSYLVQSPDHAFIPMDEKMDLRKVQKATQMLGPLWAQQMPIVHVLAARRTCIWQGIRARLALHTAQRWPGFGWGWQLREGFDFRQPWESLAAAEHPVWRMHWPTARWLGWCPFFLILAVPVVAGQHFTSGSCADSNAWRGQWSVLVHPRRVCLDLF